MKSLIGRELRVLNVILAGSVELSGPQKQRLVGRFATPKRCVFDAGYRVVGCRFAANNSSRPSELDETEYED